MQSFSKKTGRSCKTYHKSDTAVKDQQQAKDHCTMQLGTNVGMYLAAPSSMPHLSDYYNMLAKFAESAESAQI
jgi:hypothetical protein